MLKDHTKTYGISIMTMAEKSHMKCIPCVAEQVGVMDW